MHLPLQVKLPTTGVVTSTTKGGNVLPISLGEYSGQDVFEAIARASDSVFNV